MHIYRISDDHRSNMLVIAEDFLNMAKAKFDAAKLEFEKCNIAVAEIKKDLENHCNDDFVLKEKVDTKEEAEQFVDELKQKRAEKNAAKKESKNGE